MTAPISAKFISDSAQQSPANLVKEMSRWYLLSRAIHTAAELDIAHYLSNTPTASDDIAQKIDAHPERLERLMHFLAAYGIFSETQEGMFTATELSQVMRDDHPQSIRATMRMVDNAWWNAVGNLEASIKTGTSAFNYTHDISFFDYLAAHPVNQERYDAGMASNSRQGDTILAKAYDFSSINHIVDIGGGRGNLLVEIIKYYPHLKATLFDQPHVISHPACVNQAHERYELMGGNFFVNVPLAADAYLIKGVLHDFDDEACVNILHNCYKAMAKGGKVLVIERLMPTDNLPHPNKTMDLLMMILLTGKERTVSKWESLFKGAKLELTNALPTSTDFTILEACKA